MSITDNVEGGRTVNYTYDALHRLKTAVTSGSTAYPQWGLSWTYDRYGNREEQAQTHGSPPAHDPAIDPYTNRIVPDANHTYDANGNMTKDGLNTLAYDAESRVVRVNSTEPTYVYDGASLRVKKCVPNCTSPTTTTVYVFSGSKVIAEYVNGAAVGSPTREYIYSGSALVATHESSSLKFHYHDHLSARVTSDSAGANRTEQGHYPFGESWYNSSGAKLLFTSYERDSESGNDYAMFRTHVPRLGRFNRPDPLAGSINAPQSLNRYAYVLNDPVSLADPLGLDHDCLFYVWYETATTPIRVGVSCGYSSGPKFNIPKINKPNRAIEEAKEIVQAILSGNNDCAALFDSAAVVDAINALLGASVTSGGDLFRGTNIRAENTRDNPFAIRSLDGRSTRFPSTAQAAGFANPNITVFNQGAFFNSETELRTATGLILGTIGFPRDWFGGFEGGSLGARVVILLHEFAHAIGLIGPDTGREDSTANTQMILENCLEEINKALALKTLAGP